MDNYSFIFKLVGNKAYLAIGNLTNQDNRSFQPKYKFSSQILQTGFVGSCQKVLCKISSWQQFELENGRTLLINTNEVYKKIYPNKCKSIKEFEQELASNRLDKTLPALIYCSDLYSTIEEKSDFYFYCKMKQDFDSKKLTQFNENLSDLSDGIIRAIDSLGTEYKLNELMKLLQKQSSISSLFGDPRQKVVVENKLISCISSMENGFLEKKREELKKEMIKESISHSYKYDVLVFVDGVIEKKLHDEKLIEQPVPEAIKF